MAVKTILITGATDGIGLETAKLLAPQGHNLLLHGRNSEKLRRVKELFDDVSGRGEIKTYESDFSLVKNAEILANQILSRHDRLDVLINNAGVYKTTNPRTEEGFDLRFTVNLLVPYSLTEKLLPIIPASGRIVNLSSAAQAPVNIAALKGKVNLEDMPAYAQSKLALTMWTKAMSESNPDGPLWSAVNPGSLLNTNMVKEGWGGSNNDVGIGADIIVRAALSPEFEGRSGEYFDNDSGRFAPPHPDAMDPQKTVAVMEAIQDSLKSF